MIAPWYASTYVLLQKVAMRRGYALGLHGSMQRDLDLIVIPWTEDADSEEKLLTAIASALGLRGWKGKPTIKPHGRKAYALCFSDHYYADLSIMPLIRKKKSE